MQSLFNVKGQVVLVTGGGRGIGAMIARGYVENGAKVWITSRDGKACAQTCDELNKIGPGNCQYITADLQKLEDIDRLVAELSKKEKVLNVLVQNSGANWGAPLSEFPDSAWQKVLNLNVTRVFSLTQRLIPLLEAANPPDSTSFENAGARIIMIGSVDGIRVPALDTYSYSASKAALHQLSRVLASQLGPKGITVNTLACGPFRSKMMEATLEAFQETIESGVPMGRIGTPEDVAGACIFLSSRAGAFINGAIIPVDGGLLVSAKM